MEKRLICETGEIQVEGQRDRILKSSNRTG